MLITILLLVGTLNSEQSVHDAAHLGMSYAATDIGNKICEELYKPSWQCKTAGASLAATGGIIKEMMDHEANDVHFRGLAFDAIGIELSLLRLNW
jgi:hypothetical protein